MKKLLRAKKVAEMLDVHVNEVHRLHSDGTLQGRYLRGSRSEGLKMRLRIYEESVNRFIEGLPQRNPSSKSTFTSAPERPRRRPRAVLSSVEQFV